MKKRICAVILSLFLAVNLVGVPKAKAVVSEGALLGSIFGSLLVSLGYSWAADNFDAPSFGEAIYDLIKQCDEEMDTGIQLLLDSHLAGLTAVGNGKLTFSQQWVKLANSFAEWFQSKFFSDTNNSVVIMSDLSFIDDNGNSHSLTTCSFSEPFTDVFYATSIGTPIFMYGDIEKTYKIGGKELVLQSNYSGYGVYVSYGGTRLTYVDSPSWPTAYDFASFLIIDSGLYICFHRTDTVDKYFVNSRSYLCDVTTTGHSLSAEKSQEVHYPVVAEDGSQVYEVTYKGVTATDIEGIIQGAVDQILAGTAAIAGEVVQAQDVPVTPEAPAAGDYAVPGLETIFPFCIPFDIYAFCSALNADPVAPSFEWRMQYAPLGLDYTFEIDLSDFDGVAQVLRTMELLAFCVGLAFWTRHLIRG